MKNKLFLSEPRVYMLLACSYYFGKFQAKRSYKKVDKKSVSDASHADVLRVRNAERTPKNVSV